MIRPNTLVFATLTTMARQRLRLDEERCAAVLEVLNGCASLDSALHRQLGASGLSDLRFGILLALFTLAPSPACPADLAVYTGFTRSSIADAVTELHVRGYVMLERSPADRRSVDVRLTDRGRQVVDEAAMRYLTGLAMVARRLATESPARLRRLRACFADSAAQLAIPASPTP